MMIFRRVNKAIIDLLGSKAAGRFTVVGYQRQGSDAKQHQGNKRSVQSFFQQGDFPKDSGAAYGPVDHNMTFTLLLTVSSAASVDLNVLTATQSTPQQKSAALAAMQDAGYQADDLMDELFELVFQTMMDARDTDLGLPVGTVSDRWIGSLKKGEPLPQGTLLTLNGEAQFTCRCCEEVDGDTGLPMTDGIQVDLQIGGGTGAPTGVVVGRKFSDVTEIKFNDGSTIEFNDGTEVTFQ